VDYGYIAFSYTKNELTAKLIAKITQSKWSHSFIIVPPMLGKEMVMEAASNGISMATFQENYRDNPNESYEVYRFNAPQGKIDKSILNCMEKLERPYPYMELLWFVWRRINKVFGRDIKNQNNWFTNGVVCSGLVRKFIEGSGFKKLFKGFGIDAVAPEDAYEIVIANPKLFELIEKKISDE
jgi:hypothetical protein